MNTGSLVLTRKVGEKIIIGQDTTLEIVELSSSHAKIRFVVPRNVPIFREEIFLSLCNGK